MMKWKNIGILFLLIVLTVGVVCIPPLISEHREDHLLNEIVYRDYNASQRSKITSEQVARLYYNREIDIKYNSLQNNNTEKIQDDILYLTEFLFNKELDMYESIKTILVDKELSYFRSSSLILVDNQPTALNFVSCNVKGNTVFFEILYEEKTKTIISFSVDFPDNAFHSNEEMEMYSANIEALINRYFEEQLHFRRDEYYCFVEFSAVTETGESSFSANASIRCGILQLNEKAIYE